MNQQELIEKIKKLLALSNANGATEAEKDLAFQRAQMLMAKYCITNLNTENVQELVVNELYENNRLPVYIGFGEGLDTRFSKKNLDEKAIVLYDKVKELFESQVKMISIEINITNANGFDIGKKSATEAQLNPAVYKGNGGNLLS